MPGAFISYSRKDTDFTRRLYAALEQHGLEGWVDWEGIPPADDWLRKVYAAIQGADAFVFVMSPDSLSSAVCADEVAHAVKHNKRLVPVVVREVNRVDHPDIEIPEPLRRLNWIFFRAIDDFGAAVEKLVTAIKTDLEWVESHTRLLGRAIEWEAARRDDSFLLQKNDLVAAEQWLARAPDKDPKPTALQSDYIIASRTAATRRQRRLTAAAVAATILVSIGAVVATVQYVIAEIRREQGLSRQLAAQSTATMDDGPELGLLLGVYAHNVAPTFEASGALLSALERVRGVQAFIPGEHVVGSLALSADGALMAVGRCIGDADGRCTPSAIDLWRVAGPQRLGTVELAEAASRLAFSADSRRLAATACCVGEDEKARARSLVFEIAGDSTAAGGVKLVKVADQLFDRGNQPSPLEQLADERSLAATREALERVRQAAGASERSFSGTPAALGRGTRVLAQISGAELIDPVRVELWDAEGTPRRRAHAVLRSHLWGETAVRSDGRLAATFGCEYAASGRICSEAELVIIDDTGKEPRVATIRNSEPDWIRTLAVMPSEPLVISGGCGKYYYQRCLYGELQLRDVEDRVSEFRAYEPVRTFGGAVDSIALSGDGKSVGLMSQRGKVSLLRLDGPRGAQGWLPSPLAARFAPAGADPQPALKCGRNVASNPVLTRAGAQLQTPADLCAALKDFLPGAKRTSIDERVMPAASASGDRLALNGCAAWKPGTDVCEGERTTVWSIADRRLARLASIDTPNAVTALAFSPDGSRLALATCSQTRAQDCEDGKLELVEPAHERAPRRTLVEGAGVITAVAFRPGSEALAYSTCARLEDTGAVRDCALGAIRLLGFGPSPNADATLTAHRGTITGLAFRADGALFVSGGSDGSVALWDAVHRERLGPVVFAHAGSVAAVRFVSDEAFISSTETDEIEWHATPARWKSAACRIANRRLTEAEHARFLGPGETFRDPCASPAGPQGSAFWRWLRRLAE